VYTLVVLNQDGQVQGSVPFQQGELLIGRSRSNNVILPSTSVSRQHARVYSAQGRIFVQDLRSANGVVVDGTRIPETAEITPQSQIRIGEFSLVLQPAGPATPPAAPAPDPGFRTATPPAGSVSNLPTQGQLQTAAPPPPPPPRPPVAAGDEWAYAKLVGINPPFDNEEWLLSERENTVGRTEENFILLPDASVSRAHARVVRDETGAYTIYDLRSSNGTAINSRRVTQAVLRDGDLVSFGNVAFRFSGPRSAGGGSVVARRPGGSKALIAVLGIFLGVLLLGGIIVGVFALKKYHEHRSEQERRVRVEQAIEQARAQIEQKAWAGAIEQLEGALALDEENPVLTRLKEKVAEEQKAHEDLTRAQELAEDGRLEDALEALKAVPKRSVYHKDAMEQQEALQRKVDAKLLEDALASCTRREFERCHEQLVEYLNRNPENADAIARLRYAESRMRRKRVRFERWEPPQTEAP